MEHGYQRYSKINSISVKDFGNIGSIVVEDLVESPIVALIGDNNAGKTNFIKALETLMRHSNPRSQKDFIREGRSGFGVKVDLEDGTEITRIKSSSVNYYSINKVGERKYETYVLDSGMPTRIQKEIGLIEGNKESLNFRNYDSLLLFINTALSGNHKLTHEVLKVGSVEEAIEMGKVESIKHRNSIDVAYNGEEATKVAMQISIRNSETLRKALDKSHGIKGEMAKLQKFDRILEEEEMYLKVQGEENIKIKEIEEIKLRAIDMLSKAMRNREEYSKLKSIENIGIKSIGSIERESLMEINKAIKSLRSYKHMKEKENLSIRGIEEVRTDKVRVLKKAIKSKEEYNDIQREENTAIRKVQPIELGYIFKIKGIIKSKSEYDEIAKSKVEVKGEVISRDRVEELRDISRIKKFNDELRDRLFDYVDYRKIEKIRESELITLNKALKIKKELNDFQCKKSGIDAEIKDISKILRDNGYLSCKNCGEIVEL